MIIEEGDKSYIVIYSYCGSKIIKKIYDDHGELAHYLDADYTIRGCFFRTKEYNNVFKIFAANKKIQKIKLVCWLFQSYEPEEHSIDRILTIKFKG